MSYFIFLTTRLHVTNRFAILNRLVNRFVNRFVNNDVVLLAMISIHVFSNVLKVVRPSCHIFSYL